MKNFFLDDKQVSDEYRKDIEHRRLYSLFFLRVCAMMVAVSVIMMLCTLKNVRNFWFMLGGFLGGTFTIFLILGIISYKYIIAYQKRINFDLDTKIKKDKHDKDE